MNEYILIALAYLIGYAVGHTRALASSDAKDKSIHVYVDNSQKFDAEQDDSESWKRGGRPGLN